MENLKSIVILGGGFGGIAAARPIIQGLKGLGLEKHYCVILIDRNLHHTYTPVLYEVATTSKSTAHLNDLLEISAHHIPELLHDLPFTFIQGEVTAIDLEEGDIHLKDGQKIRSDYLVLALGAEPNYFGIPGLKEHAIPFKTFLNAVRVRDAIWNQLLEEKTHLEVVVAGAGSTGVELAGELTEWCKELQKEFAGCRVLIKLIEASPEILPGFDQRVITKARKRLASLGVTMMINCMIAEAKPDHVVFKNGETLPYDVLIWTGGIKAPDILTSIHLKTEPRGRVEVASGMICLPQTPHLKLHPMVYGLGDSVCFVNPKTGKPVPGMARAAIAQAHVVAHNLLEDIKVHENIKTVHQYISYHPTNYPYILPIGGKYAISKLRPVIVSGLLGWILKGLVELNYLRSIMPFTRALHIWFKGLSIFIRNDRLG